MADSQRRRLQSTMGPPGSIGPGALRRGSSHERETGSNGLKESGGVQWHQGHSKWLHKRDQGPGRAGGPDKPADSAPREPTRYRRQHWLDSEMGRETEMGHLVRRLKHVARNREMSVEIKNRFQRREELSLKGASRGFMGQRSSLVTGTSRLMPLAGRVYRLFPHKLILALNFQTQRCCWLLSRCWGRAEGRGSP